jgi:hypothetical protein
LALFTFQNYSEEGYNELQNESSGRNIVRIGAWSESLLTFIKCEIGIAEIRGTSIR